MKNRDLSSCRLASLDILRGIALYGILFTHFVIWYTGSALPKSVYTNFQDTGSQVAMALFGTFFLGKFFSIFSFLFGTGITIQQKKLADSENNPSLVQSVRLFFLLIIGFIHHLFWRGDILMIYAFLGIFLVLAMPLKSDYLLVLALFFLFDIPSISRLIFMAGNEVGLPMYEEAIQYNHLIRNGLFWDIVTDNYNDLNAKLTYQMSSGRLFRTLGFSLLGMYAVRQRWFDSTSGHETINTLFTKTRIILIGMIITGGFLFLTGVITYDRLRLQFLSPLPLKLLFDLFNLILTSFYITGILVLIQRNKFFSLLGIFREPGRMSMTTYLMQSVLGVILFYGLGFGLIRFTSPGLNGLLTIPVFAVQIIFSRWWLKRFSKGPAEWVWTKMTFFGVTRLKKLVSKSVLPRKVAG